MNRFIFIFLCIIIGFTSLSRGQENPTDNVQKQIAFADYLFNTRQFEFAAEEYLKLVFLYPENPVLKKRALESFRMAMDFESGLYFSNVFFDSEESSTLTFYNEIVKIRMLSGKQILTHKLLLDSTVYSLKYYESQLLDYMLALNWDKLNQNADKIKESDLYLFTQNTPQDDYLSPFLAASLSTIIPGSGKIYAKR